jgi:putative SOS response-associated peptidase YedK
MKWGLVPSWSTQYPTSSAMSKTINCRDDSLRTNAAFWAASKANRCIILAEGFYEWRRVGKFNTPYYIKRKDDRLMLFAGLWDVVKFKGLWRELNRLPKLYADLYNIDQEKSIYTFTIITTDANDQIRFLHNRMPAILDEGSPKLATWLGPHKEKWSDEIGSCLKPYDKELVLYPVSKDVGKIYNDSPSLIVPVDSTENRNNIANYFAKEDEPAVKDSTFSQEEFREPTEEAFLKKEYEDTPQPTPTTESKRTSSKRKAEEGVSEQSGDSTEQPRRKAVARRAPAKTSAGNKKVPAREKGDQLITDLFQRTNDSGSGKGNGSGPAGMNSA